MRIRGDRSGGPTFSNRDDRHRGKFLPSECGNRLKEIDGLLHLTVVPADQSGTGSDLTISQADMDSLIRSKAAMYTILETITASVGMTLKDLKRFYVAGTFGSFIDPRSAITIGMLPDLPLKAINHWATAPWAAPPWHSPRRWS